MAPAKFSAVPLRRDSPRLTSFPALALATLRSGSLMGPCRAILIRPSRGWLFNIQKQQPLIREPFENRVLVSQRLSGLQRKLNSLLRLLLAAERFEAFALEIEDVLFAHRCSR